MNPVSRWFNRRRVDREIDSEMAAHLAEKLDQLREDGHSAEEAGLIAHRQFGNATLQREDSRDAWGWTLAEQFAQDLRFGARMLARDRGFAITAIAILSLAIGMNTAMFSAVQAVLLSALPYPEPERIVELAQSAKDGHLMNVSGLDFRDWRAQNRTLQAMATYNSDAATISGDFRARRVRVGLAGSGFFEVLGTPAAIGRVFTAEEQKPGAPPTLLLSDDLAAALFQNSASAIGKIVRLNGMAFGVVGVMPRRFDFPDRTQLWLPADLFPDNSTRSAHNFRVAGRLKPEVTLSQVQADMNVIAARLAREYDDDKDRGIRVASLSEWLTSSVRRALQMLLAAVALVLLIACINISNLQLARAASRQKEMSMRSALGAPRSRLLRQLLTESVMLAALGGMLGVLLAGIMIRVLRSAAPENIPRLEHLTIDGSVLAFTAVISLVAGLLAGVLPALQTSHIEINDTLKQGAGKGVAPRGKLWGQSLAIGQIALAMMLLSGAALLLKSYWKLAHVETGFTTNGVFSTDITWPGAGIEFAIEYSQVRQAASQMLEEVQHLPGIQAEGFIHGFLENAPDGGFEIEGRPLPADPHLAPWAIYRTATAGFFSALGIPIQKGRSFSEIDNRAAQQVAIVNQSFEREFFPRGEVVGKRIRFLGFDRQPQFMTVIGVVPDLRAFGLRRPAQSEVYANFFQHPSEASLIVRGPTNLQTAIERILNRLNPSTAVNFEDVDSIVFGTIARDRFNAELLTLFAASALLLAVLGVYGLLSYSVSRRTSELGVRMALGASDRLIARMVLRQGGALVLAGIALGSTASLLATRTLQAMLYQVETTDPFTLLAVVAAFVAAALLGCYLPARRASRINPSEALRNTT